MLNTTKLRTQLVNQFIANCTVVDLGSGSFPRLITVRTPQADGAAQVARWWGNRRLAVGDVITCRRDPNDLDVLAIDESGDAQSLLHNFAATAAPATGDDNADGYEVGSLWVDVTNDNAYICLDATAAAAVWRQIDATGGGSSALTVRNNSSVTANAGVCGYLSGRDFYIGTAGNPSQRCIVTTGGTNGASIEVQQHGNCTASYTGTAPSAGDPLKYDGISGVTKQSAADTDTMAYATAAGSGGSVDVLLVTGRAPVATSSDRYVFTPNSGTSGTDFVATINGTPSGSTLVYNTPSAGTAQIINLYTSNQLAKIVLHNTTRSEELLIDSVDTGTSTITFTATVPGTWASGDTITIRSQTNTDSLDSVYFVDFDLSSSDNNTIPATATQLWIEIDVVDSGAPDGIRALLHPYQAGVASSRRGLKTVDGYARGVLPVPIISQRFQFLCGASGSNTMIITLRIQSAEVLHS